MPKPSASRQRVSRLPQPAQIHIELPTSAAAQCRPQQEHRKCAKSPEESNLPKAARELQRADTAVIETHLFLRSGRRLRLFRPAVNVHIHTHTLPFTSVRTQGMGHQAFLQVLACEVFLLARCDSMVPSSCDDSLDSGRECGISKAAGA